MYTVKHINVLGYKRWHVQSKFLLNSHSDCTSASSRVWRGSRSGGQGFRQNPLLPCTSVERRDSRLGRGMSQRDVESTGQRVAAAGPTEGTREGSTRARHCCAAATRVSSGRTCWSSTSKSSRSMSTRGLRASHAMTTWRLPHFPASACCGHARELGMLWSWSEYQAKGPPKGTRMLLGKRRPRAASRIPGAASETQKRSEQTSACSSAVWIVLGSQPDTRLWVQYSPATAKPRAWLQNVAPN